MAESPDAILTLEGVKTYYPVRKGLLKRTVGHVKAVDGVDLQVFRGETLGLVGESGCGKSTLGKTILRLVNANAGRIVFKHPPGVEFNLMTLGDREMMNLRRHLQIIFQDPHSSLNPAFTVFGSLEDPLKKFGVTSRANRRRIVGNLLEAVNLRPEYMDRYPHEFSGGQRQRIGIARALSVSPQLIICDEAVSALDVSIQAQVLKLLKKLKDDGNLTYIFITHDLSAVEYVSDRIAVMYLGRIVELADSVDLYTRTMHPYTQALLSAIPIAKLDGKKKRIVLKGDVPNPLNPPSGCPFHPRCFKRSKGCDTQIPELTCFIMNNRNHYVSCHYPDVHKKLRS